MTHLSMTHLLSMINVAIARFVRLNITPVAGRALALVAVLLGIAGAAQAQAERRVALVLGNGAYQNVPKLINPVPDAQAVSATFKSLGYDVIEAYDTDLPTLQRTIKQFREKLDGAKAAVFYYAGHGIAVKDDNFILPVDARLQKESDIDFNTVPLRFVINQMEQETKVNIVLLDACRDNPFEEQLKRSLGTRSSTISRGLAAIDTNSTHGLLISFATSPRNVAYDGTDNANSPFTRALLRHMPEPGVPISVVMDRVREDVYKATNEKQRPWVNTSIIGEFFINPKKADALVASANPAQAMPIATGAAATPPRSTDNVELTFWESVQKAGTVDEYKAYLSAYPAGTFAALAKSRIETLQRGSGIAAKPARAVGDTSVAGTATTERNLKLKPGDIREIHDRLRLLSFDPGASAAKFGPQARGAITNWQKSRNFPDTGFLTEAHRNDLLNQTDEQYARWKAAAPMAPVANRKVPQAERPVKRTIREAQSRRVRNVDEYDSDPAPINRRPPPQPGTGAVIGGAILGGVVGGALGGAFRRR